MIAVAIETSAPAASVAVRVGDRTLFLELSGRAHASDLLPCIAQGLEALGARPDRIGCVVVGTGPGSYTGLRVGSATALGLARGSGASLVGLPSVEALAYERLAEGERGAVLLDARAGAFYFAHYLRRGARVETLEEPCAIAAEDVARRLPEESVLLCDPAALERAVPGIEPSRLRPGVVPRADVLLELGLLRSSESGPDGPGGVKPLYLRPFGVRRGTGPAR